MNEGQESASFDALDIIGKITQAKMRHRLIDLFIFVLLLMSVSTMLISNIRIRQSKRRRTKSAMRPTRWKTATIFNTWHTALKNRKRRDLHHHGVYFFNVIISALFYIISLYICVPNCSIHPREFLHEYSIRAIAIYVVLERGRYLPKSVAITPCANSSFSV